MSTYRSPYGSDTSLTREEREAEKTLPEPPHSAMNQRPQARYRIIPADRVFVRGPWEMLATILIAVGVVMLMQPFFMFLFGWSFAVILTGTVMFLVVSHFPDRD